MKTSPIKSLQELSAIQKNFKAQQHEARLQAQLLAEQERKKRQEQNLFRQAIGNTKPLQAKAKVLLNNPLPLPIPKQRIRDEQMVLEESLSDELDVGTLLETDDQLSFRRPGVGPDVTRKLRRGEWSIQKEIDLHGLRTEQARETLSAFIRQAHREGARCLRVIHGKGLGSPGKTPVLKDKVHSWLIQKNQVLAFVQAQPTQGGAGALLVLIKPPSMR